MKPEYLVSPSVRKVDSQYNFRPAGHTAPPPQREYKEPDRKLEKAFDEWVEYGKSQDELPGVFSGAFIVWRYSRQGWKNAVELVHDYNPSIAEAHAMTLLNRNHPERDSLGIFLSAIYSISDEKEIVYDLDLGLDYIGFRLPEDKILINRGKAGRQVGEDAKGKVINYGETVRNLGIGAKGLVINAGIGGINVGYQSIGPLVNFGKAEEMMGTDNKSLAVNCGEVGHRMCYSATGLVIAVKNPKSFGYRGHARRVFDETECQQIPELLEYFDKMKAVVEAGRTDTKALATLPSDEKLQTDVEAILRRAGKI